METKGKNQKKLKDMLFQFITVAVLAALALLLLNVLSVDKDGRRQVVDGDGAEEYMGAESPEDQSDPGGRTGEEKRLAEILSQIKGVGQAEVMITWQEEIQPVSAFSTGQNTGKKEVKGVIIAAEGACEAVTKSDIIRAVSSVYDIPPANVMVFEKESGGLRDEIQ